VAQAGDRLTIFGGAGGNYVIEEMRRGSQGTMPSCSQPEAFGVKCEMHMSGFGNPQILGATSEDVCEYYERGLEAPGVDTITPPPYLEGICDPLAPDGTVAVPQEPGMGYRIRWDYVEENRIR
jgi:L-alanine-DL-glutamate epimerase-like enolase superfamily enzyme